MSWLQLLYSKSVRDLVQWSLRFLRDPQALSSTLAALGMVKPRAFEFLKRRRDLGLSLKLLCRLIQQWHAPPWPRPLLLHMLTSRKCVFGLFYFTDLIFVDGRSTHSQYCVGLFYLCLQASLRLSLHACTC